MQAIWQVRGLKSVHIRLIWWLVDVGAVGRFLAHGWQGKAASQLGVHRVTLGRATEKLVNLGIAKRGYLKGDISLNPDAFANTADIEGLTFRGG